MNTDRSVFVRARLFRRRFSRQTVPARWGILAVTALMTVLPFWVVTSNTYLKDWFSNRAMAATVAAVRNVQNFDAMTDRQKSRHAHTIHILLRSQPDALFDLGSRDILVGFSRPHLQRREGTVEVWQYRADDCVLDIFLEAAEPGGEGESRVIHYEFRSREKASLSPSGTAGSAQPDPARCIHSLATASQAVFRS